MQPLGNQKIRTGHGEVTSVSRAREQEVGLRGGSIPQPFHEVAGKRLTTCRCSVSGAGAIVFRTWPVSRVAQSEGLLSPLVLM